MTWAVCPVRISPGCARRGGVIDDLQQSQSSRKETQLIIERELRPLRPGGEGFETTQIAGHLIRGLGWLVPRSPREEKQTRT